MPKSEVRRVLTGFTLLMLPLSSALAGGFEMTDRPVEAAEVRLASAAPIDGAGLSLAIATAATEARRMAAQSATELAVGGDGNVDLSLSALVDLTLRSNLDIRVSSYQPALSAEALAARKSIFDPLMQFTMSLFSSTSPTAATLEGADVLSNDRQNWNFAVQRLTDWGGTAQVSFNNQREKTNSQFQTLNPNFNSSLNLSYTQPVLRDFGKDITKREIRIAANNREASVEAFRDQVINSVSAAVDAYWDLYGKTKTLSVRRESLALAQDLLRINRTRVEVGTMAPLEVASAEAEVARNEELLILAEHDVRTAEDRILGLINVSAVSPLWEAKLRLVDEPTVEGRNIEVNEAIETAFEKRPNLRRQALTVASDRVRLDYANNQLKPGLSLQFSYGLVGLGGTQVVRDPDTGGVLREIDGGFGDALDGLKSLDFDNWRVAATVDLPLFNQLAEANRATALLTVRQGEDSLEAQQQSVAVEIRRLTRVVQTNLKSIDAARVTRELQEKRLDAEQKKFEHGLSTNFEVSQAQQDLTEARNSEILATTNYNRALALLDAAMGTVLDTYGVEIVK